ncbi:MAG: WG repeat-containing protein [Marinifilaceae bacterium]|jgi:hypothetical protein|nr:WG repeat-containing protein [Marinifilaceae bacterium]
MSEKTKKIESRLEDFGYPSFLTDGLKENEYVFYENKVFDHKGKLSAEYNYNFLRHQIHHMVNFDNEVAFVEHNNNIALMNIDGEILIDQIEDIDEVWINHTYIAVQKEGKWGVINNRGEVIVDFIFTDIHWQHEISDYCRNYRVLYIEDNGVKKQALFAFTGKLVLKPEFKEIKIDYEYDSFTTNTERTAAFYNDRIIGVKLNGEKTTVTHKDKIIGKLQIKPR